MSSLYFNSSGVLFENIFEPALNGDGVSDPGYKLPGGALMTFAPLSLGTAAPATGYGRTGSVGDLNTLWAKLGSVSYLVSPDGFNGANDFSPCWSLTWGDYLYSEIVLNLYNNGTWAIIRTTTNHINDNVPAYNANDGYDYSGGLTLATGNWAQNPAAGVGNSYTVNASGTLTSGYVDYPTVPTNRVEHPGAFRGPGTVINNRIIGGVNGQSLSSTVQIGLVLDAQGVSTNSSYADANSGLSWYNVATISIAIFNTANSSIQTDSQFTFTNELRWGSSSYTGPSSTATPTPAPAPSPTPTPSPTPAPSPTPSPAPSPGSGGGGGCVAVQMYVRPDLKASEVTVGEYIDGVAYKPDRMVPRLVDNVSFVMQPCYRMVSASGIELIASDSTPMTMPDGSVKMFPEMLGELVLVDDYGLIRWEQVKTLEFVGDMLVALISMDNQNYFAGTEPYRRIGSHNVIVVK